MNIFDLYKKKIIEIVEKAKSEKNIINTENIENKINQQKHF